MFLSDARIQMVCVVIYALMFILFIFQRKPKLKTELAFFWLLVAATLSCVFEILSNELLETYAINKDNEFLTRFISKTYLVSIIALSYTALNYICRDVYNQRKALFIEVSIAAPVAALGSILTWALPLDINNQEIAIFGSGPSMTVACAVAISMLASCVGTIIAKRKTMNIRRIISMSIWLIIWISVAAIELSLRNYQALNLACCVGIVLIFMILENPALRINPENGLFNMIAYNDYIYQHSQAKQYFTISKLNLTRVIENVSEDLLRLEVKKYEKKLLSYKDCSFFKDSNHQYYLITYKKGLNLNDILADIVHYFRENITSVAPHILVVKNPYMFMNINEVEETFNIIKNNDFGYESSSIIMVDEKIYERIHEHKHLIEYLKNAIDKNDFEVYYQPLYNIKTQKYDSAEALCRMRTSEGNILPPEAFIKLAEQNGVINKLGEMVFQNVCRFISKHDMISLGIDHIEINLSVIQCATPNLAENFIEIMRAYGVNPERINLEITETGSAEATKIMLDNMSKLIKAGVTFSLDDFGTGNSNLDYLLNFPIEIVKFDYTMVHAYFSDVNAKYIMNNAISMINGLKLKTVIEGIETKEEYDIIKELDIDYIQGFYFCEPLPENEYLDFIERKTTK